MKTKEEILEIINTRSVLNKEQVLNAIEVYATQYQEDNAEKKYTEADIRKAINVGISAEAGDYPDGWSFKLGISLEDYFINSLNKQD